MNALDVIDKELKDGILDLWEPVHDLLDRTDSRAPEEFYDLIPGWHEAMRQTSDFHDELGKKFGVPWRVLQERLFPPYEQLKDGMTRLYMAIGFVLGLRLSGISDQKINELLKIYSFGLTDAVDVER